MFKHVRALGVLASAAAMVMAASPSFASADKCSKLINGEILKMQSTFAKGFGKCNDAYRKDAAKPPTPAFSKAAPACQKELDKAFAAMNKEIDKLASNVPKTCTDADLIALGHLPTAAFGRRWAETQGVGSLQSAYEQALLGTQDWVNMLITMGNTGSCASCTKLSVAPCSETACKLSAGSGASVDLKGSPTIPVPLAGSSVLKVCDVSTLLSSAGGVLYVIGGPGRILDPAPVSAIATACTATLRSEGVIQCGAGPQKTNYVACVDHIATSTNVSGSTTSGDCTGDACAASSTDVEDAAITNGGPCIDLTNVAGTAGDAFINLVSRIELHAAGSDCLDQATNFGTPQNTALTTGTSQAKVLDADGSAGETIESTAKTGTPFDCATLKRGDGGPVKLVGAFGALNTLTDALLDSVTGFTLECE